MRYMKLSLAAGVAFLLMIGTIAPASAATPTGHKHVTTTLTSTNRIVVDWKPTSAVKYYKVRTSSTPDMSQDVKTVKVAKSSTKYTINATADRYAYAKPSSGNYIFVRVYAIKKNGKIGISPYKKVRLHPVTPPAGAQKLTVATFNVRTADSQVKGHSWNSRVNAVADLIDKSNADVVALQEAGANLGKTVYAPGQYDIRWQFEDVDSHVDSKYALVYDGEYSTASNGGKEGTRILYDTTAVRVVETGFFAPSKVTKYLRWVPWALFENTTTGERFYFISAHLDNRKDSGKKRTLYELRVKQIDSIIDKARDFKRSGHQVILAGDLNSNIYSQPRNGVHRKLIAAGFYDAYATGDNVKEFRVTYNGFAASKKSASRTDYILTFGRADLKGAFRYRNWTAKENGVYASDHNMQSAIVPF
jgi:endonuclease/exonuclease/phosphatase family metal-dependent hydrolase